MNNPARNWVYRLVLTCYLLSGAAGLVYAVVWSRMLAQIFGNSAPTAVLVALLAGLAGGSYLFGRFVDRSRNELFLYGVLGACLGIYGCLVPWLFRVGGHIAIPLLLIDEPRPAAFVLLFFVLAFVPVAVPAMLNGAMLPTLSRALVRDLSNLGRRVGSLYAANALGAALGTAVAGYYLLENFGMALTTYIAAGVNLLSASVILAVDRLQAKTQRAAEIRADKAGETPSSSQASWIGAVLLVSFGLSGFSALVYQYSWNRILTLVIGTSVYSSTAALVSSLAGLAIGGFVYARLFSGGSARLGCFGLLELGIGASALAILPFVEQLPLLFLRFMEISGNSFPLFLSSQLLLAAMIVLIPSVLLGATFPMAFRLFARDPQRVGSGVGNSYGVNFLGAMCGALAGGFLLIPAIGIQHTLILAALVNFAAGALVILADTRMRAIVRYSAAAAGLLAIVLVPLATRPWDPAVLASGITFYHRIYQTLPTDSLRVEKMHDNYVVFYREGPTATVSVHEDPAASDAQLVMGIPENSYTIRTDGEIEGSHNHELARLLSGYIPMMLKPDAKKAAVIGLGTGLTAKAVAAFPIESLEILETEPAMVEASAYFSDANGNVLSDPRVRIIASDPRYYFAANPKRYDVITSEPSNPWSTGIGDLYTVDFYQRVKERLTERGVFAQSFDSHSMSSDDFLVVLHSFAQGFPRVSLWALNDKDFLLVGSKTPQAFEPTAVEEVFHANEGFREDLEGLGLSSVFAIPGFYRLGREQILEFADKARINTDDRVHLEYSAPRSLLAKPSHLDRELIRPFVDEPPWLAHADAWGLSTSLRHYYLAQGLHASGVNPAALAEVNTAIEANPSNSNYFVLKAKILLALNREEPALQAVLDAVDLSRDALPGVLALSGAFGRPRAREEIYRKAIELNSENAIPLTGLGTIRMLMGAGQEAEELLDQAGQLAGDDPAVLEARGLLKAAQRRPDDAREMLERARELGRDTVLLYGALGDVYTSLELWEPAVEAYRQALRYDIRNTGWRRSLGLALVQLGRIDEAEREFRDVLALRPDDALAWEALEKLGRGY